MYAMHDVSKANDAKETKIWHQFRIRGGKRETRERGLA